MQFRAYELSFVQLVLVTVTFAHPVYRSQVQWIPSTEVQYDALEDVGPQGGMKLCIGRSNILGGILTGKTVNADLVWLSYKGKEFTRPKAQFQVLVYAKGHLNWVSATNATEHLPPNMLQGGIEPFSLEPTYICRALHSPNVLIPGRVLASDKICKYPYFGEKYSSKFEVLVKSDGLLYEDPDLDISSHYVRDFGSIY